MRMLGVTKSYQNYQKGAASNQLMNFEREGKVLPSNAARNFGFMSSLFRISTNT
jgi:hypothetical protein